VSVDGTAIDRASARLRAVLGRVPERWFVVDVARQLLLQVGVGGIGGRWTVSTAAAGVDARQDSGGTPPGVHRIAARIGDDQPPGTVFVSREPTGEIWRPENPAEDALENALEDLPDDPPEDALEDPPDDRDLILTRILTLEGLEAGVNCGPGVDTLERMIYLHGTNHEASLGRPTSHGCIRLSNRDVLEVFAAAAVGDPVVIV
jgi:UDP-N-acetylmuramate--alanine ligase